MKKKVLTGLLVLVLTGEGYLGYEITQKDKYNTPDFSKTNSESQVFPANDSSNIYICSFNIQFLGNFKKRDNQSLAYLLKNFDIVIVQELLAPPFSGVFPDGEKFKPNEQSAAFFKEMINYGFKYVLSEEDTGPGEEIHKNSSATEWWVAFYKNRKVRLAMDLPHGFLATDRSNNPDYDRVPYAFPFRSLIDSIDFVLISVHLAPNVSGKQRREHELSEISSWINDNDKKEKDFIILGDMNIENKKELDEIIPTGYKSLNDECRRTNTLINNNADSGARPYDHVMYRPRYTSNEIDEKFDFVVLNLIKLMKPYWTSANKYPGAPITILYSDNTSQTTTRFYSGSNLVLTMIN